MRHGISSAGNQAALWGFASQLVRNFVNEGSKAGAVGKHQAGFADIASKHIAQLKTNALGPVQQVRHLHVWAS